MVALAHVQWKMAGNVKVATSQIKITVHVSQKGAKEYLVTHGRKSG